jgi:hypothetical protein
MHHALARTKCLAMREENLVLMQQLAVLIQNCYAGDFR